MIEIMIEEILQIKHRPVIIAIDGRCREVDACFIWMTFIYKGGKGHMSV
ncbi:MAG: hypothetical protein ACI32Q_00925 [Intestinibaculum porci]